MRNPTDAEDVTQTTFLNAYRAYVEKGSRPEKPQNWLIAIAHNVCRQRFRQTARRPAEVSFEDDIADTVADDEAPSGEDIRRALGHLAFNQRAALVMRELEGRSYAEIAEILEVSTERGGDVDLPRPARAARAARGSLTCGEAEFAISRQLDGRLPRGERGQLRAHLRECAECAGFARRQRAQRGALKTLALVPVPSSLMSLFGGGAAVGTGLTLKAAAAVTAGLAIGGASYEGVRHVPWQAERPTAAAQNAVGGIAAARDAAFAPRGPSRVVPAVGPGTHGQATKTKNVDPKKGKKAKTHGRANQTGLARNGSSASHGRGADQSNQAGLAGGTRVHPTAKLKPKRLRLPGPIGERPAHRRGKHK